MQRWDDYPPMPLSPVVGIPALTTPTFRTTCKAVCIVAKVKSTRCMDPRPKTFPTSVVDPLKLPFARGVSSHNKRQRLSQIKVIQCIRTASDK